MNAQAWVMVTVYIRHVNEYAVRACYWQSYIIDTLCIIRNYGVSTHEAEGQVALPPSHTRTTVVYCGVNNRVLF
jgi:hypothetical protein